MYVCVFARVCLFISIHEKGYSLGWLMITFFSGMTLGVFWSVTKTKKLINFVLFLRNISRSPSLLPFVLPRYCQKVGGIVLGNISLLKVWSICYVWPHFVYVFPNGTITSGLNFEGYSTLHLLRGIFMPKFRKIGQIFNENFIFWKNNETLIWCKLSCSLSWKWFSLLYS